MKSIQSWKLREFRQNKSLTISQFANKLSYNPTLIFMYEQGIKRPGDSFWDSMNNTYNISPDYFTR
ncbi:helix-turn-helix domain-containing protein [Bacillus cereus]|uniref:helix-turn-helix domain-containing protein n=1 Tax=Bacillus cereus TaxID=1396 RepID=UPI003D05575E